MNPEDVKQLLSSALPDCDFQVENEGSHYNIVAIGDHFASMRVVQRQQAIYKVLNSHIADGSIHAVNMKIFSRAEWQSR